MKETFVEVKNLLLGPVSVGTYVAAEIFALLALIVSLSLSSKKRDKDSANTPYRFSWYFLIWDNAKRIMVGQILLFLIFRFTSQLFGKTLSMEAAVGIGVFFSLGLDQAIAFFKSKFGILQMNRENLPAPPCIDDKTKTPTP